MPVKRQLVVSGRCILLFCAGLLVPSVLWAGVVEPLNGWIFTPDSLVGDSVRASSGDLDGRIFGGARVESWVRLDSSTRWGGICGYIQDNGSFERGWLLGYNDSSFSIALATSNTLTYLEASDNFELGSWYHVVGTYNGSELKIYVNGQLEGSSRSRSGDIDYADASLVVGAYVDDNELWPLEGQVHEAQIYNTVLSQADARERYLAKRGLFGGDLVPGPDPAGETGIVAQWTFDNEHVNGRLVSDRVGSFDGTIQGEYELLSSPAALALDGSSTFVRMGLPGGSAALPRRELTAEAWVQINEGTTWGGSSVICRTTGILRGDGSWAMMTRISAWRCHPDG